MRAQVREALLELLADSPGVLYEGAWIADRNAQVDAIIAALPGLMAFSPETFGLRWHEQIVTAREGRMERVQRRRLVTKWETR